MGYASALARDPDTTYRQIDLAGRTTAAADGPALVQLLYDELIRALRAAAWATDHRHFAQKGERLTRATAILFALEAGLDFDAGGDVSHTLARLYVGAREQVVGASLDPSGARFRAIADQFAEIAQVWQQARAA